ncbi:endoplasmic reticulum aminopeptidase 1-like isoform X2 [Pseudomyrmex gracilis]|uniref:endoplasmic reticulum aminopeptidase 1-like isoform X2 n=1 Tax=Pseudomyrmex gracilis TaxID=219809 RepID=UPI00099498E0|nr:endoplasmic reticulum aminopeptidase 1-like isoform X2 [Pseudomyrmex gracilis]
MPKGSPGKDSENIQLEPLARTPKHVESADSTEADAKAPLRRGRKTCDSDSNAGLHRRNFYERANEVVRCSERKTYIVLCICCLVLLITSLIIALAPLRNGCDCTEELSNRTVDDEEDDLPRMDNGEMFPWDNIRLPTFAHPTRYNLTIHPNLTTLDFRGRVTIEFYVDVETNFIVFHSKNLTIKEQIVKDGNSQEELKIARFIDYPKREQLYLELETTLRKKNNYTLFLSFNSTLISTELKGFYISSFVNANGEQKYLATTLFEPTYARRAFPCFDEPQFKAKFKVSIYRDRFHIALCNMPVINTEEAGFYLGTNLLRDDFQESVEMSTYLVAFVVCDYDRIYELTKRNTSVSIYAAANVINRMKYAVSTAARIMDYFESFFGISYPLPKQDLIAIPNLAPPTENWGLITFQEPLLQFEPKYVSTAIQENIAITLAHELAHQWFGNLVTMSWWNDIWLKEGAASFLEYKSVDHISPDWNMMDLFILRKTQVALELDVLANSHPMSIPFENPTEIKNIYDEITCFKGPAILYMLEKVVCEDVFKHALNDYLNSHAYGNTDINDFWEVLTKHARNSTEPNTDVNIRKIMDTWTQQTGYPLVTIARDGETVTVTQKRFLISPQKSRMNVSRYKWFVPLNCYADKEPEIKEVWMNMTNATFEMPSDEYIKCNINQTGFYRVNYPDEMWDSIVKTLMTNHTRFSPADRANLIDDAFSLCDAGELNVSVPLKLSLYLVNERDYVPWATALRYLNSWKRRLGESEAYKKYISFWKRLLGPITKFVGWKDEGSHLHKFLRTAILESAIELGMEDVVNSAKTLFQERMSKNKFVAPNLRYIVYLAGVKFGGETEWRKCWQFFLNIPHDTQVESEKTELLQALGATTDPWLLKLYLRNSMRQDLIAQAKLSAKSVDTMITSVGANSYDLAWRHIKAYWPQIEALYVNESLSINNLIATIVPNFITEYDFREVVDFFKQHDVRNGNRVLLQSLEMVKFNIHWIKMNAKDVNDWLTDYFETKTAS